MLKNTTLFILSSMVLGLLSQESQAQIQYQRPAESLAQLVDAPVTPSVMFSPTRETMLFMHLPSMPSIAEMAAPELRLAGMRINPRNNGPSRSRGYVKLVFRDLDGGEERPVTGFPEEAGIRNVSFAPDGMHIAFTVDMPDRISLFVADVTTAEARMVTSRAINDAGPGTPYRWVSDNQTLLVRTIHPDRGAVPEMPLAPGGPVVQENIGEESPARTYQDLLQNSFDEMLFAYYMEAELLSVSLDGNETAIGEAGLLTSVSPSPDGQYVLVQQMALPFSYLVPYYRFPRTVDVFTAGGEHVRQLAALPLAESVPTTPGSVPMGPRNFGWRSDTPATLYWTEALDGGDARKEADFRDQVYTLSAPFAGDGEPFVRLPLRYAGISWGHENLALVRESWYLDRKARVYTIDPSSPEIELTLLFERQTEDRYNNPGTPLSQPTAAGTSVLLIEDGKLFLSGAGASPEGDRPFLRSFDLGTQETTELFRSEAPYYERPVVFLDEDMNQLLTRRETTSEPPNYFIRELDSGELTPVTSFSHPYPELAGIQKEVIEYTREDGIPLSATLYLPLGYDAERDGPLPGLVWAYPNEYKSAAAAGQRRGSPYQFNFVSYSGFVPFVTRGYAVINNASMPVIGEGDQEPNDTFREQLISNAQSAIDEGVRRGVLDPERVGIGGHSYGAFMTANLLAHSDLFKAGVARSGAYNRTLTPFGFQNEQRLFWESPETYYYMSPFMHVDKINEPILLIHGEVDNNSGTFPMQSRRLYGALKGLGKTARLVMLPHESHGYRSRESVLHVLWETDRWLEAYVKSATEDEMEVAKPSGD